MSPIICAAITVAVITIVAVIHIATSKDDWRSEYWDDDDEVHQQIPVYPKN
jgi:hypothetical protein